MVEIKEYPVTLKEASEHFGIDYQYFRDKFLRKVLGIYTGLTVEPLKDAETHGLTEFGMQEVQKYIDQVKNGEMSHAYYRQQVREAILLAQSEKVEPPTPTVVPVVIAENFPYEQPEPEDDDDEGLVLLQEEIAFTVPPILNIQIENLQITIPVTDTTAIDAHTLALQGNTGELVNALAGYVAADLHGKMQTVIAQNTNLAAGIQQSAVAKTVKNLGVGKTVGDPSSDDGS